MFLGEIFILFYFFNVLISVGLFYFLSQSVKALLLGLLGLFLFYILCIHKQKAL